MITITPETVFRVRALLRLVIRLGTKGALRHVVRRVVAMLTAMTTARLACIALVGQVAYSEAACTQAQDRPVVPCTWESWFTKKKEARFNKGHSFGPIEVRNGENNGGFVACDVIRMPNPVRVSPQLELGVREYWVAQELTTELLGSRC